jgi:hypothetical protein
MGYRKRNFTLHWRLTCACYDTTRVVFNTQWNDVEEFGRVVRFYSISGVIILS